MLEKRRGQERRESMSGQPKKREEAGEKTLYVRTDMEI
jgi:hypothetical protein